MPESLSRSVQTDLSDSAMDRRSFLRTGLGGAMFLGTVSVTAGLSGCVIRFSTNVQWKAGKGGKRGSISRFPTSTLF